jgi:pyrroline-5-carboxylate reductase
MTVNGKPSLCLIGAGNMGSALLGGWAQAGDWSLTVFDPQPNGKIQSLAAAGQISLNPDVADLNPDIIVLALKPQVMAEVLDDYAFAKSPKALILSIAAGKKISFYKEILGASAPVVRAMPNTPSAIGLGISVAVASPEVSEAQKSEAERLLRAVGEVAWTDKEADLNAVTALSGSGPAYVFLMIEAMTEAGIEQGLDAALARKLALQTVRGSGELAVQSGLAAAELRKNVTSPGGTTAAALEVLMKGDGLSELMRRAIKAATERAKELSSAER